FMHASAASLEVDFRSTPRAQGAGQAAVLASRLAYGSLVPETTRVDYTLEELGVSEGASIEVFRASLSQFSTPWQSAAEIGGALPLQNGASYLAILLGPDVTSASDTRYNEPQVTLIPTGTERADRGLASMMQLNSR